MTKHGFIELGSKEIRDIGAVAVEYRHERSGAKLLHLVRDDENKTFLIAFKTPPKNHTGVFHIIEHSVLCGSDKFPVKEPFVELLKSSLNTFLNAMTYPDKTVYPVSSMNDKDFYNLVNIYMDAVLHPAFRTKEEIFMQEAHRLEINESGTLTENGVVYNEMKGAYSSPDEIEQETAMQMVFAGTPYAYSSGGDPDHIPELTYEEFLETHKKHYNPTDAYIVLDGAVNTDEIFPLLDSYLSEYENKPSGITIGECDRPGGCRRTEMYSVSEAEGVKDKTRMSIIIPTSRYDELERSYALSVVRSAVAGDITSPFISAVLGTGLCENVYFSPMDGMRDNAMLITFINVKDGKDEELLDFALDKLSEIARTGIDKSSLRAALSSLEFVTRERNFGSLPLGIVYALTTLDTWLYSDDSTAGLYFEEHFATLAKKIETDHYDKLLAEIIPDKKDALVLTLKPSTTLDSERAAREEEKYGNLLVGMSEDELSALKAKCEAFASWQKAPDTPEALATLPRLSVSDIKPEPEDVPTDEYRVMGTRVISHPIHTAGITYLGAHFDIGDLTPEECTDLGILCSALTKLPTSRRSANELRNLIKTELGYISFVPSAMTHKDGRALNDLTVSVGVLDGHRGSVPEIVREILADTVFDSGELTKILTQKKLSLKEIIANDGLSVAIGRACAAITASGAINEYYTGLTSYEIISSYTAQIEKDPEFINKLIEKLTKLYKKVFSAQRLTLSVAGGYCENFVKELICALPSGAPISEYFPYTTLDIHNEGIEIPSRIGYATLGAPLDMNSFTGDMHVVRTILNYEYLWSEIRAAGGAYGAGEIIRDGFIGYYSYRDPSPARSIEKYKSAPDFLRAFAKERPAEHIEQYIIGTFSTIDGVKTPRMRAETATSKLLCGIDRETSLKRRREALGASSAGIARIAELIDSAMSCAVTSTVASRDLLSDIKNLDKIHTPQ